MLLCAVCVGATSAPASQLVEAINEDYSDYVGLSSKLTGLEGAVVRMRQPLLEIQVLWGVEQHQARAALAASTVACSAAAVATHQT